MLHRAVGGRKIKEEGRPGAWLAADLDLAAVVLHDTIDEGEPDAAPLSLRGKEGLEDVGQVALGDAMARIADPQLERRRPTTWEKSAAQPQLAALRHSLHGVDAEVPDRLPHLLRVDVRGQRIAELAHHFEVGREGAVLEKHDDLF